MSRGLDATVVVRLLTGVPPEQAAAARALVEMAAGQVVVSDLVVAESYRALRHHYGVPHREAVHALRQLVNDPRIRPTGIAPEVLQEAEPAGGAGLMDRLIHADYGLAAASLHTFDRQCARLPGATLMK